jgi:hypothetical protein
VRTLSPLGVGHDCRSRRSLIYTVTNKTVIPAQAGIWLQPDPGFRRGDAL